MNLQVILVLEVNVNIFSAVFVVFVSDVNTGSCKQGRWEWTDGTAWDYTHWAAGQPQNWILENCLGLWDLWHDVTCTESNYALDAKYNVT